MDHYLSYEFTRAVVQKPVSFTAIASAADTITATAHELSVGDVLAFTDLDGLGTIATGTRYFVVAVPVANTFKISATRGGSPISIGTADTLAFTALREISFSWPNQANTQPDTQQITWEGGGDRKQLNLLRGMTVAFAAAAIPAEAHAEIFDKAAITGNLPGGMVNGRSYGGGKDRGGVVVGFRLEGLAIKIDNGVESDVGYARWFPQGVLTLTGPATQQTGQASGPTGYSFTPSKVAVDLLGVAIAGISTGGDFYIEGEVPV